MHTRFPNFLTPFTARKDGNYKLEYIAGRHIQWILITIHIITIEVYQLYL